ncbi:MAG TPA: APC family permease [Ktedonobacterales bacterium]
MSAETTNPPALPAGTSTGLRPNAVGLLGVLFQSVTLMGPGVAVAFAFGPGITYAGGSFPLALTLALVGCLLLASNISQMAIHLPSAGGMYTYISRGLGRSVGFLAGWITIPAYLVFIPLNLLAFGYGVHSASGTAAQPDSGVPWWIPALVLALLIAVLTWIGVRPSLRTLLALGAIEVVVFIALSGFLINHAGSGNTLNAFTPATWDHNRGGLSGVLVGTVIAFLAFTGFESAALLAEESSNPRRNIPRAIFLAVICIGLFFVLAGYAGLAGYGFDRIGTTHGDPNTYLGDPSASPWFTLAQAVWGTPGKYIIQLVVLSSLAANVGAGYTALARVAYAMGRAGALPAAFGRLSRRFRTPALAIFAGALVSFAIAVWSALVYGAPPNSFYVIVDVAAYCVLLAYIGVSVAVPLFFRRERRSEFNVLRHVIIPAAAVLLLVGVLVAQFLTGEVPDHYPSLAPQYLGAFFFGGWLLLGLIWLVVLRARKPAALDAGMRIYVEEGR